MALANRLQNAWNAFANRSPTSSVFYREEGTTYSQKPDRTRFTRGNERTIVTSVYNRMAMDVAAIDFKHVKNDQNGRYVEDYDSGLNNCLTLEANIDQTGRSFIQDIVMSMFDEGCVAICPVDTDVNPEKGSYDIITMRVGRIVEWKPKSVKVRLYNDREGRFRELYFPKENVAIIENPLFAVINEPNSTMKRLIRKLSLLDYIDEESGAGKLDMIIQLPYVIKTEARRQQAENRRKEIEKQLSGSNLYGIAYTDGTEHITQLNRSVENNLMKQIEYLTSMLYSQLGLTEEVLSGSADEKVMLNYYNRTVEPICSAITDEFERKFLTKTARSQHQAIRFFRDPFRLVPVADLAELADKFTRNEIMTSNEIRQVVGMKPSDDPNADKLRNANLSQSNSEIEAENGGAEGGGYTEEELANMSDEDKEALAMLEKQYGE